MAAEGGFPRLGARPRFGVPKRIELRQIGIRDQSKMIGLAPCGKQCCCAQYLTDFKRLDKDGKIQLLSLNPSR